jgi:multiple sugar transport system permease protein
MLFSAYLALSEWNIVTGTTTIQFVGFSNFVRIFDDPRFYAALRVTFTFCLISIPFYQITALLFAFLLSTKMRGMRFFRLAFFLPSVIPAVAASMIWLRVFGETTGILNQSLRLLGITGPAWLANPATALYAFIIMGVWGIGQTMIIYLAGIRGVDTSIYEASEVDGANVFQKFVKITLPMISPTIFFNVVMAIIGSFQYFTQAFVMTSQGVSASSVGGPLNSTLFYNLYLYVKAFQDFEMGYAAALSWILFVIIMAFTLLVVKSSSFWVHYQSDDMV